MWSAFTCYRAATLALFIAFNAVICTVAAWNLGFAHNLAHVAAVDTYLIFVGASGLIVVFTVLFIEVFRRNAFPSCVAFEVVWLTVYWVLNFGGAAALSAVVLGAMCGSGSQSSKGHKSSGSSSGSCVSARTLVVFAWLNTVFMFLYFLILTVFAIMHQKEDTGVWRASVREFPWFATKQCIRSAPSSPMGARFASVGASLGLGGIRSPSFGRGGENKRAMKPPSFAAPKPRRPPPVFMHERAGLSSQVEIEHFSDVMSTESNVLSPTSPQYQQQEQQQPKPSAYALYSHSIQMTLGNANAPSKYVSRTDNTYSSSHPSGSPPPIRDWPRPMGAAGAAPESPRPRSERSRQKQRAPPPPPSRSSSGSGSRVSRMSSSGGSRRAAPPPPLSLQRTESAPDTAPLQTSPSREKPTGPRTRGRGEAFVRPRPPPLDLTREGATPVARNRR